jgi:hypothetical protein
MDKSKAIAGGSAWMIAIALQVVSQTWPNVLPPHPWVVAVFVLAGAGTFAYASIGHKKSREASNLVGRDHTGHQIHNAPGGIVHVGDTNVTSNETKAQTARGITGSTSPLSLPMLEVSFALAFVKIDDEYPQFGEDGQKSIVVRVRNKPAALGEVAHHARDIFAQLDFDCAIGKSTVERAYWVDQDNNQITLSGGDEAWVFVGVPEQNFLSSWHNANTYSRRTREWNSPTYEPEGRAIPWSIGELRGQIYIISHNPRGNITLAHKQFVFTREAWTNDFGNINLRFIE